jgi:hypothetical protein
MRWWNERIADLVDVVPLPLLALLSLALTTVVAVVWYRPRHRPAPKRSAEPAGSDELPNLPAHVLADSANRLASTQDYALAVRDRLRAIVRELVEAGVIPLRPGWTVTELARSAVTARPALEPALTGAVTVFSAIWYGLRPATVDDDAAMRSYAQAVSQSLRPAARSAP